MNKQVQVIPSVEILHQQRPSVVSVMSDPAGLDHSEAISEVSAKGLVPAPLKLQPPGVNLLAVQPFLQVKAERLQEISGQHRVVAIQDFIDVIQRNVF